MWSFPDVLSERNTIDFIDIWRGETQVFQGVNARVLSWTKECAVVANATPNIRHQA